MIPSGVLRQPCTWAVCEVTAAMTTPSRSRSAVRLSSARCRSKQTPVDLGEGGQHPGGQRVRADRQGHRDRRPARAVVLAARAVAGVVRAQLRGDLRAEQLGLPGEPQERLARRRGDDRPGAPHEHAARRVLQRADALADGGRRHVQRPGRRVERALGDHGGQVPRAGGSPRSPVGPSSVLLTQLRNMNWSSGVALPSVGMLAPLAGLGFGLSLIVAIGAQNAFVLRQGLRREHVGVVGRRSARSPTRCSIAAGGAGFGPLVERVARRRVVVRWLGAAVVLGYGALAAWRAVRATRRSPRRRRRPARPRPRSSRWSHHAGADLAQPARLPRHGGAAGLGRRHLRRRPLVVHRGRDGVQRRVVHRPRVRRAAARARAAAARRAGGCSTA